MQRDNCKKVKKSKISILKVKFLQCKKRIWIATISNTTLKIAMLTYLCDICKKPEKKVSCINGTHRFNSMQRL